MTKKTIGKEGEQARSLLELVEMQKYFQEKVTLRKMPVDDVKWFMYHVCAMQEEVGEVLKADKRWKTHRNTTYIPDEKKDEIADVFITILNIALFSGIDGEELFSIL